MDTRNIFYERDGIKFYVGDKVSGKFGTWGKRNDVGVVKFGEFDAFWPTGAHEMAYAFGFYVELNDDEEEQYSIVQIMDLRKLDSSDMPHKSK